jgi:hypothetical protein
MCRVGRQLKPKLVTTSDAVDVKLTYFECSVNAMFFMSCMRDCICELAHALALTFCIYIANYTCSIHAAVWVHTY